MPDLCPQCKTAYRELAYPRPVKHQPDRDRCRAGGLDVTDRGMVVWISRFFCDCQWRAQCRMVSHDLVERLLPDPAAQAAIYRRTRTTPPRPTKDTP